MENKKEYNILFNSFLLSVVLVFLFIRPFNTPWHRFIAGDGLGYYAYLPAKFIYEDKAYDFKWFNAVFDKHYINFSGGSADDNFLVKYKDKRINKYYPGLSFVWLPFFVLGHLSAMLFQYPMDGFSLPYQWSIGLASLSYLFLGLFYLKKLLYKLFKEELIAAFVPILIFYGSFLFHYALDLNSLSHVYSFSFMVLFLYFSNSFFNEGDKRLWHLGLALFSLLIIVLIRPLNLIVVLAIPALWSDPFFKTKLVFEKIKLKHVMLAGIAFWALIRQFSILHTQSGSFFPNTYEGEQFYFSNPKLWDVSFSYHAGFFVYVPIAFVALWGIVYLQNSWQKIFFPLILLLVIYLYSSWWYWPITSRALVDYYFIPAILLAALLHRFHTHRFMKRGLIVLLILLCCYHQLKSLQFRRGVLDENYTHKELFWSSFFRTYKTNAYPIPPKSIIKKLSYSEHFEDTLYKGLVSSTQKHEGLRSAWLNDKNDYTKAMTYPIPTFFTEPGLKKVRFSFYAYFSKDIEQFQIYINFYNKQNQQVLSLPFYVKKDAIRYNVWEDKAFGCELSDAQIRDLKPAYVSLFIWNNELKNEAFIDELKTEFVLCDKSYEIVE